MSDLAILKFSLDIDSLHFDVDGQQINIAQGLSFIQSQAMRHGVLNELAIENMIDVIEQLLESSGLNYSIEKLAITSDLGMLLLNDVFFQSNGVVDRIRLEKAFNDFIEHIAFYQRQVRADQQDIFAYFIFIREMMHHLNVMSIEYFEK